MSDKDEALKVEAIEFIRQWQRQSQPIDDLVKAIVMGSLECAEAIKPRLKYSTEDEKLQRWFQVICEYLYFFTHITNRFSLTKLGQEGRLKLHNRLIPILIPTLIDTLNPDCREDIKNETEVEMNACLQESELEYAKCKESTSNDLYDSNILTSKMGMNIANASGNPMNSSVIMFAIESSSKIFADMELHDLVEAVGKVL
ncbi:MAG: hypothetical protein ACJ74W_23570 [Pyrinomonadaceae bacterium]